MVAKIHVERILPALGMYAALGCLPGSSSLAEECEDRVPIRFILETTLPDRFHGTKAGEEVVVGETSPQHFTVLRLEDGDGLPVCWKEITFVSRNPDQVDFLTEKATTNGDGVVANVLLVKVDASRVRTVFTVREGSRLEATFGVRGVGWVTDASPFDFVAPPLEPFFGPTQVLRGRIGNFRGSLPAGFQIRAWAIDPRIAEPSPVVATDTILHPSSRQEGNCEVTARAPGDTVLLIDTLDATTYTAEVRGDIHPLFIRGDCNLDDLVDLADAVFTLDAVFRGGALFRLFEACNTNDDASVNIADAIYLLSHLFRGGPEPPPPFPAKDMDPDPPWPH